MAHEQTLPADSRTIALSPLTKHGVYLWKLVVGDTWEIERIYTGLAGGCTISKAYWTVKRSLSDLDAAAVFQIAITSASTTAGQIIDGNSNGGSIHLTFIASITQTATLTAGETYYYDVQGIDTLGQVYTFETGCIEPQPQVTRATT